MTRLTANENRAASDRERSRPRRTASTWTKASGVVALLLGACGPLASDDTAIGAARAFVEASGTADDQRSREEVFRLLCPEAQTRLGERARSASALGARTFSAAEMLVEGRLQLRITPRRSRAYSESTDPIEPDRHIVHVVSESGTVVDVPVRRVDRFYCVELRVPDVSPDDA